ncbi:isopentenyl phosphate kinase [Methanocaldococcus sp.]
MLIILKLGGSILSDKKREFSINWNNLERVALEIKEALNSKKFKLIIVHGGGSFGHPVAKKYLKDNKFNNMEKGFWEIQRAMRHFNNVVINTLQEFNIPALSIQPSSFVYYCDGLNFDLGAIKLMLDKNLVPVIHGDVIVTKDGFKILSGDDIVPHLSKNLKADRVLYATDVDGIIVENKVIDKIDNSNFDYIIKYLSNSKGIDVTGGMKYKIIAMKENKIKGLVFNGNVKYNIYKALLGEKIGTEINFGDGV